ncbi:MAG: hypothetical protein O3A25_00655 [Acidobacteria bacterium]|nr:hypothetical protein [Acidobacteriota bacterium]
MLFPLFLHLPAVASSTQRAATATAFGVLQGLVAVLFFTWRDIF